MAFANVQDGHLRLEKVKSIRVKTSEIEKYRVLSGDFLKTEGGDPDKLSRGAIWQGEIDVCLHQDHIFEVRCNPSVLLSKYLWSLVGSYYEEGCFIRVAKQITGIASINKTQLCKFLVLVPPLDVQEVFNEKLANIEVMVDQQNLARRHAELGFQSLLHTAFSRIL